METLGIETPIYTLISKHYKDVHINCTHLNGFGTGQSVTWGPHFYTALIHSPHLHPGHCEKQ